MSDYDYDLFVIGGGSGGVRAAKVSADYGAKVAIAEESRYGGTCVIRGCVPKKLMVYASGYAEHFEDAAGFGWDIGETRFDWARMCAARDEELDRLEGLYLKGLQAKGIETIYARATIKGPHTITLTGGREVTARYILIATGGRPRVPSIEGAHLSIVSDDLFHLAEQPKSMIVIGGGYVAVEFACIFQNLGTQVTLANRSATVLKAFDQDLQTDIIAAMEHKGMTMMLGRQPTAVVEAPNGQRKVYFDDGTEAVADVVFFATGRRPNVANLGLETVGITPGKWQEIGVDDYSKTVCDHIYAVGDVTDRAALTPVAIREGMAFAETVFNDNPTQPDHDLIPTGIFTQPEIGTIGLSETDARSRGHDVEIYRARFRPMVHTLSGRDEKMLMKLVVDRETRKMLGVHILGHAAGEMIQCVAIAMKMGATKEDFDRTMAVHPTAAEELVTMREPTE